MVRTYRTPKIFFFFYLPFGCAICAAFIISGPAMVVRAVAEHDLRVLLFSLAFSLFSVGGAVWVYGALDIPYEIRVGDDGVCEFRSLLHRRQVRAQQIVSLRPEEEQIYVRHQRGRIRMYETHEFADFLDRLRALNPAIRLEGDLGNQASSR